MKLKILLSTEGDPKYSTSLTIRIVRIAELLKELYDVKTLILPKGVKNQNNVFESIYRNIILSAKQLHFAYKYRPDIIYCSFNFGAVIFYYLYSRIMNAKVIFEIPGILSREQEGVKTNKMKVGIIKWLEKLNARIADYVVGMAENVTGFYSQFTSRITTVECFVDIESFRRIPAVRDATRKKLGIGDNEKLVGLVGPFNTKFNQPYIQFLRANHSQFDKRIKFLVIGNYADPIIDPRILNAGFLADKDYREHLSAIDILLAPNKYATSGGPLTKILDAAASGSATVTTHVGYLNIYYFENGKNIIIRNEDEIIDYLNETLFADDEVFKLGLNARAVVEKYYSEEIVKNKLIELIDNVGVKNSKSV